MLLLSADGLTQSSVGDVKEAIQTLLLQQNYYAALNLINQVEGKDQEVRLWWGICNYEINDLKKAGTIFSQLVQEKEIEFEEAWLYYGKVFHARHEFSNAINCYKNFLSISSTGASDRMHVRDAIRRAAYGMRNQYKTPKGVVESFGRAVNTIDDEFAPILSPNFDDRIYFSSIRRGNYGGLRDSTGKEDNAGRYFCDIFSCEYEINSWGRVKHMGENINTAEHEVLFDFSPNGRKLYFFRGLNWKDGFPYTNTVQETGEKNLVRPFNSPLESQFADNYFHISGDTMILFTSNRPGGFGGQDLYKSYKKNGFWTFPENLGPTINTAYDEATPFLSQDGQTLFFSSNNPYASMGGLDIFYSKLEKDLSWGIPENLGLPINSSGDDAYFRMARDGETAFFSSSRKDGTGQRDLYIAFLEEGLFGGGEKKDNLSASTSMEEFLLKKFFGETNSEEKNISKQDSNQKQKAIYDLFSPILVSSKEALFLNDKKGIFDQLGAFIQAYPNLNFFIFGGVGDEMEAPQLYEGIKQAEDILSYLAERGVNSNNIFLRGSSQIKLKGEAQEKLRYIDFKLSGDQNSIEDTIDYDKGALFSLNGLSYRIQVASAQKKTIPINYFQNFRTLW